MGKIGKSSRRVVFLSVLSLFFCAGALLVNWVAFNVAWTPQKRDHGSNVGLTSIEQLSLFSANDIKAQACYSYDCGSYATFVSRLHRSHLTAFQIAGLETLFVVVCLVSGLCVIVNLFFLAAGGKQGWVGLLTIPIILIAFIGGAQIVVGVLAISALGYGIKDPIGVSQTISDITTPPRAMDTLPYWNSCTTTFIPPKCSQDLDSSMPGGIYAHTSRGKTAQIGRLAASCRLAHCC